ncbi:MAG: PPOX class F420-dependent oxidoreductase [Actinomycetota bacterium]|nr:PPOX class F420-dependent oxidoreductase [Actinomycetota bacterium]
MELDEALVWVAEKTHGILITIRRDGRAQSSDISFTLKDGKFCISATASRAKTRNLLKDDRAVLHVTSPKTWSYISFDGTVEVTSPAQTKNDEVNQELAEIYQRILGEEHPNWEEFQQAMINDGRLVLRLVPQSAVGMVN